MTLFHQLISRHRRVYQLSGHVHCVGNACVDGSAMPCVATRLRQISTVHPFNLRENGRFYRQIGVQSDPSIAKDSRDRCW